MDGCDSAKFSDHVTRFRLGLFSFPVAAKFFGHTDLFSGLNLLIFRLKDECWMGLDLCVNQLLFHGTEGWLEC